jgi:hypothetical protein
MNLDKNKTLIITISEEKLPWGPHPTGMERLPDIPPPEPPPLGIHVSDTIQFSTKVGG